MKCKEIQELILTDYLDNEVTPLLKVEIEQHLVGCTACREFESAAKKAVIEPFRNPARPNPTDSVWQNIRERIETGENQTVNPSADIMGRIKSFLFAPKPALVTATVMALLLLAVIWIKPPSENKDIINPNIEEQIDYMAYLVEGSNQLSMDQGEGYGTSIEEFFL